MISDVMTKTVKEEVKKAGEGESGKQSKKCLHLTSHILCFLHYIIYVWFQGCDASILIDPVPAKNRTSEKMANPNLTIRGFDIIDDAKNILETVCPSTVSCADIIALATRDAVALSGGPTYLVPTGRRDGLLSDPSQVNLPGPNHNVSEALSFFTAVGLTLDDMVTLLGAHTVGFAHCNFFQRRLANPDPTLDPTFRTSLAQQCGALSINKNPTVFLEPNTPDLFDNQYYRQILKSKGVLNIDQQLALDPSSKGLVSNYSVDTKGFREKFADAMIKMGNIGVLVGNDGEIRKNCRAFNIPI